jgi:ATP-binding cassette, subfamily B, multidrug efflux pump
MSEITAPAQKPMAFGPSVRRLLGRLRPHRVLVVWVAFFAALGVLATVLAPALLGQATNIIVSGAFGGTPIDFPALATVLAVVLGLYVIASLFAWLEARLLNTVVQRTTYTLREEVERKINALPLSYFDRSPRGDLLSRVTNDMDNLSQSLQQTLSQALTSLLTIVGVVVMMFVLSPLLAVVTLVSVPLTVLITVVVARRSQRLFVDQWAYTGELNAQVEEMFTGHAITKVFGRQRETAEEFRAKNRQLYRAGFGAQFVSGIIMPAMMFVGNLVYVVIAVVGGLLVSSASLSLGTVQAFIQYSRQFTQPLTQLGSMVNLLQSGVASAERVFALLDAEEQSADPAPAESPHGTRGRLVFDDIRFGYRPDKPLITGLSLTVEPGQTIAIVGPTGAGKTTLVNLILRFYELDGGRITLDGVDIARMTRDDLRSRTGMVLQDTWLFGGTIRENIAYGRPDATDEEIFAAARATYVERFVHSLPDGYETVLDDEAAHVSAGEKQLITIARAFLAQPNVLILDEATSSVDTRTELLVQKAMSALRADRTSFVIAHRLSTIRDADVILVMDEGDIVEQGDHHELLAAGGAYAALYNAQFIAGGTEENDGRAPGTAGP